MRSPAPAAPHGSARGARSLERASAGSTATGSGAKAALGEAVAPVDASPAAMSAAEVAVGLALLVALYKKRQSASTEHMNLLRN